LKEAITPEALERDFKQQFTEVKVKEAKPDPNLPPGTEELRFAVTTREGTKVKSRQDWYHEPALFFGAMTIPVPLMSLSDIVWFIGDWVIGGFGAGVTMLISTILTASFLPGMLNKGTVDMLLVKPIHRTTLFVYKYLGGLLFMFLNTLIIMTGIWLVIGLRTGTWVNAFLVCILVFTFQFAIFYAVMALVAVLTRSTIVCILSALMTWVLLFALGWAHWAFIERRRADAPPEVRNHWAFVGFDVLYTLTPRYKELDWLTSKMIQEDLLRLRKVPLPDSSDPEAVAEYERRQKQAQETYEKQLKDLNRKYGSYTWTGSILVTSLFIVVVLGVACWRFSVKDY
jgi:hypothetical protein